MEGWLVFLLTAFCTFLLFEINFYYLFIYFLSYTDYVELPIYNKYLNYTWIIEVKLNRYIQLYFYFNAMLISSKISIFSINDSNYKAKNFKSLVFVTFIYFIIIVKLNCNINNKYFWLYILDRKLYIYIFLRIILWILKFWKHIIDIRNKILY